MNKQQTPRELDTPIKLKSESEKDRARELYERRREKLQLLLDMYVPTDLRLDPAQQWCALAIELARKLYPGFGPESKGRGRKKTRETIRNIEWYATVRRHVQQTGATIESAIDSLIADFVSAQTAHRESVALLKKEKGARSNAVPPEMPEYLKGYFVDSLGSEEQSAASGTLKRKYYAAQSYLREVCGEDAVFEGAADLLVWHLENNPSYFDEMSIEEIHAELIMHTAFSGCETLKAAPVEEPPITRIRDLGPWKALQ